MRHAKHRATIKHITGSTRDSDGRTTPIETSHTVPAIVSLVGAREQFIAEQEGRTFSIAIQVDPRVAVFTQDEVVTSRTDRLGLDGRYRVVELRPDRYTQRLLCERYEV